MRNERRLENKPRTAPRKGKGNVGRVDAGTYAAQLPLQRMQRAWGNRATAIWLSQRSASPERPAAGTEASAGPVIQLQRDLTPGTTVNVSQGVYFGKVKQLIVDDFQPYDYVVRVESKSVQLGKEQGYAWTTEKVEEPFEESTEFINEYLDGDEFQNRIDARVAFYSDKLDTHATGVLVKATPKPLDQEYDVSVSWDRGLVLPVPYVERFKEPEVVQADEIPPAAPLRPVPKGGYKFTHFHESDRAPRASEYLEPGVDDADVTKHGLGSGVYGLSGLDPETVVKQEISYGSKGETIELDRPLHLQHDQHGEEFTVMSKRLQKLADSLKNKYGKQAAEADAIEKGLKEHASVVDELTKNMDLALARVGKKSPGVGAVKGALQQFLQAYFTRPKFVAQPINYLMELLGFDGVFAETPRFNAFDRGNIKYVPDTDRTWEKTYSKNNLRK